MKLNIDVELDYVFKSGTDVLLAIEAAPLPDQTLLSDLLTVNGTDALRPIAGEDGVGRRTWIRAEGPFLARYKAVIEVTRTITAIEALPITPTRDLPAEVIAYLWPSRYCESDKFEAFVERQFGSYQGGAKVTAMANWIWREMAYCIGSSDATTTAVDAFVSRQGVCRDYAHIMTSFARAAGIPARMVSAFAWDLYPPDFHAVVEVWLGDEWHLVDATRLAPLEGLARICVGRDATDIAFMTSFGPAEMRSQRVTVTRAED
jgi:transglutaminase-like putative cysteine protease